MCTVKLFMLIGDPVDGTLSPAMFNAAFKELGLNYVYVATTVPKRFLADAINGIRTIGIAGLNITIPHKIPIMRLLDGLDASALATGAVNTVENQRGKLVGFNTDGDGALKALEEKIGKIKGKRVLLLGAGGAARAIAFSIARAGANLTIANRTTARTRTLASEIERKLKVNVKPIQMNRTLLKKTLEKMDVLINATSVGMSQKGNQTLVTSEMMHPEMVVHDIVYKPLKTSLLREAQRAGAETVDGLGMLLQQAALAFKIWTNRQPPIKVMAAAAKNELRRRKK